MTATDSDWKRLMRKHWSVVAVFVAAGVLVAVSVVFVFRWFVGNAQSTGLVPASLGLWTWGHLVSFIVNLILYELLLIGIPIVVAVLIAWQWLWKRLPDDERRMFHLGRRRRRTRGGGGVSLFFFIAFSIKIYLDGNWNVPIATLTLNYVVDSAILILALAAVIIGIPAAIGATWWIRREMKKP